MKSPGTHYMYFVAILCPAELDKKILPFKYWMKEQFGSQVALKSPAHITFIQPFWLETDLEEKLKQTLQDFKSDMDVLEIQLDGFSHFGKKVLYVRVLENPALEELKNRAEQHFTFVFREVIKKDDRPFHPHITIASRDLKPGDLEKARQYFSEKVFREKFYADTISLLKLEAGKWNRIAERKWR